MAQKPKVPSGAPTHPLTAEEIAAFVGADSDFAFEMRTLAALRLNACNCEHGGTYEDPVTGKLRQFDIRAERTVGDRLLALAIECKNLRNENPLLVSTIPRTEPESFHQLLHWKRSGMSFLEIECRRGQDSIYHAGEAVGKKTDQLARDGKGGIASNDAQTYDKISQAVNSCNDLLGAFVRGVSKQSVVAIVPVLVVPDGALWQANYDSDGTQLAPPYQATRVQLTINHAWKARYSFGDILYQISHLEIITFSALPTTIDSWVGASGLFGT